MNRVLQASHVGGSVFPWRDYELFLYAPYRVSIYHLYSFLLTVRKISSLFLIINAINKLFVIYIYIVYHTSIDLLNFFSYINPIFNLFIF